VVAGTVTGVVAHVSSLPFVDAKFEDVVAVAAMFGIGTLLATGGFLWPGSPRRGPAAGRASTAGHPWASASSSSR
jgi:hypothetical protein